MPHDQTTELHLANDRFNVGNASSVKDSIIGDSVDILNTIELVDVVVGHDAVAQSVFDNASTFLLRRVVLR